MGEYWVIERDVDGYFIGEGDDIINVHEIVKRLYKLAEYENDETVRRRADAHKIKELRAKNVELQDLLDRHLRSQRKNWAG